MITSYKNLEKLEERTMRQNFPVLVFEFINSKTVPVIVNNKTLIDDFVEIFLNIKRCFHSNLSGLKLGLRPLTY